MKIAVDARSLNRYHLRGIGKVLLNIIEHSPDTTSWVLYHDRTDLPMHIPDNGNITLKSMKEWSWRFKSWEQIQLPMRLLIDKPDLAFFPANSAPLFQPIPAVVILHDVIRWNELEQKGGKSYYMQKVLPKAIRRAKSIITISKFSADDICRRWPDLKAKLSVIQNGINSTFFENDNDFNAPSPSQKKYFIYFGGAIARKRLNWALDIWMKASLDNHEFWLCGIEKKDIPGFDRLIDHVKGKQVRFLPYITEKELPNLIRNATAVVYPTLYEGFGLPVIEAASSGTACLFSDVSSLSELIGPHSIVLPQDDQKAWSEAIRTLAESNGLSADQSESAKDWSKQFDWNLKAKEYYSLFESTIGYQQPFHS